MAKKINTKNSSPIKSIKKFTASFVYIASVFPIWILQMLFFGIGILGFAMGEFWIVGWLLRYMGLAFFPFSYLFISLLGTLTLLIGLGIYTISRVDCLSGNKGLFLGLSFVLYWVVLINWLPWFLLWVGAVLFSQKKDKPVKVKTA